ncbi:hypothetical protein NL676_029921 [Syzygium grande]|nr:hypothetical protein NL676_029921 [Syzygium grande]
MAATPIRFGTLVEMIGDVINVARGRAYLNVISQVMVDEGLEQNVPYVFEAWYEWNEDGELIRHLYGFNGPFGGVHGPFGDAHGPAPGTAMVGPT